MGTSYLMIQKGHVVAILIANAVLWSASVLVTGNTLLGGAGAIALVSIASLMKQRSQTA